MHKLPPQTLYALERCFNGKWKKRLIKTYRFKNKEDITFDWFLNHIAVGHKEVANILSEDGRLTDDIKTELLPYLLGDRTNG